MITKLTKEQAIIISAYTGFFGCKHFSKCNEYLRKHGQKEILW